MLAPCLLHNLSLGAMFLGIDSSSSIEYENTVQYVMGLKLTFLQQNIMKTRYMYIFSNILHCCLGGVRADADDPLSGWERPVVDWSWELVHQIFSGCQTTPIGEQLPWAEFWLEHKFHGLQPR